MLFHFEIGFPDDFQEPEGQFRLWYSQHSLDAAKRDRYGNLTRYLPTMLDTTKALLVECELQGGQTVKLLYRVKTASRIHLVIALVPHENGQWVVKTVWGNDGRDGHATLDRRKYVNPRC